MARFYLASQPPSGELIHPWAASMRWGVNYNGLITIGVNSLGVYLSVFFLFRPGHPPLFIPFGEIAATRENTRWFKLVRLRFEKYPATYLLIPYKKAEQLSRLSGFQLQIEEGG